MIKKIIIEDKKYTLDEVYEYCSKKYKGQRLGLND